MTSVGLFPAPDDTKSPHAHSRFLRFVLVGSSNFLIGLLLFYGIMQTNIAAGNTKIVLAQTVAYVVGGCWSFFWNRTWAFSDAKPRHSSIFGQSLRFALLQIAMYLGSVICLLVFIQAMGMPYVLGWIVSTTIITAANFLGMSYWIFPGRKEHARSSV